MSSGKKSTITSGNLAAIVGGERLVNYIKMVKNNFPNIYEGENRPFRMQIAMKTFYCIWERRQIMWTGLQYEQGTINSRFGGAKTCLPPWNWKPEGYDNCTILFAISPLVVDLIVVVYGDSIATRPKWSSAIISATVNITFMNRSIYVPQMRFGTMRLSMTTNPTGTCKYS